jgi:predicted HNH restriction endonuclease
MKNTSVTPLGQIKRAVRLCWLRSRERNQAIKDAGRACTKCGKHSSVAVGRKVVINAHHTHGIDWDGICRDIRDRVFQTPADYTVLCEDCHHELHENELKQSELLL